VISDARFSGFIFCGYRKVEEGNKTEKNGNEEEEIVWKIINATTLESEGMKIPDHQEKFVA
jgi:hypothetical protein